MGNSIQIINEFNKFMQTYKGGNPKEEAMRLINSSGMSQQRLNQMQEQANQLYNLGLQMGLFNK